MTKVSRIWWRALWAPGMRPFAAVARDQAGTSAIEFAFIAPALMLLALGTVQFGLTINNYICLTEGVRTAGRQLAVSRGGGSRGTPYQDTVNQIYLSAPSLTQASPDHPSVGERHGLQHRYDLPECLGQRPGTAGERQRELSVRPEHHGPRFCPRMHLILSDNGAY